MERARGKRRGRAPASRVTLPRASRLYRMVRYLGGGPRARADLLEDVAIGLRTFYRELELVRRCGVGIRLRDGRYQLIGPAEEAGGKLPVPDPHLNLAEVAELARSPGPAGRRMAELLTAVHEAKLPKARRKDKARGGGPRRRGDGGK